MKRFKKVIAAVSATVVGVAALAGCTRMSRSTSMFDVMKNASELEKFTYEVSFSMDGGGDMMDVTLMGKSDGDSASLGFKAMMNGMKYEIEEAMIVSGSVMYLNIGSIKTLIGTADVDLSEAGITGDWISVDFGEELNTKADNSVFLDALDEAYDGIIEEKDGEYEIRISSDEDLLEFVDSTINLLNDNADDFAKEITEVYNETDYVAIVKNVFTGLIKDVNKHFDAGKTDAEITEVIDEVFASADTSELEVDAAEIKEAITDLADKLEDSKDELSFEEADGPDKITVSTYQEEKSYVFKAEAVGTSDGEKAVVKMEVKVTGDNSVSVKAPDKNVQSFGEVLCEALEASGVTSESIDELFEKIGNIDLDSIGGVLGNTNVGTENKNDITIEKN